MNQTLPPIKAKQPGRGGRKHTLGSRRLNSNGEVEIYILCSNSRCGCAGWYTMQELFNSIEHFGEEEAA